jgi:hypothetical protein
MGTHKEQRSHGFPGRVRMICVALNYEGTDAPLGCWTDNERISKLAAKSGCADIVKLYDNGETPLFPDKAGVTQAIREMGERCGEHDYLVFCYSGHGDSVENAHAPSGKDCMLCLRTRDGEDEKMIDDELATLITTMIPPQVRVLVLIDACHSGGIMDFDTPGVWAGTDGQPRRVCCISGCTENQLSTDSGDGGVMTNALIHVLNRKKVRARRKKRDLSVQFVFNRMVAAMPEDDDEDDDDDDDDEEEEEWEDDEEWSDSSTEDDEDDDEDDESGSEEPGQDLTLSWPAGRDPSKITWPF